MTDLLFLPVSGPTGYGEYARCLIIAEGLMRANPALSIAFGISRTAPYFDNCPWPTHALADTPTRDTAGVNALLDSLRPRMVVFDSCGRSQQYRHARQRGIQVAFISSRPASRRRVFTLSRIGKINLALLIGDPATQPPGLGLFERLRLALFGRRLQIVHAGPIFLPADDAAVAAIQAQYPQGFALFVPGGGGTGDSQTLTAFHDAAARFAGETGARTLLVLGPNARVPAGPTPGELQQLHALPPQEFINHLAASRLAVTGGGSVLSQSFALGVPSVGIALGASDQRTRVQGLAAYPGVRAASTDAAEICRTARETWRDFQDQRPVPPVPPGLPVVVSRILDHLQPSSGARPAP